MIAVKATIRWSRPICKEMVKHGAWPTIARKTDGEFLVVFSADREEHVCPYGKSELIRIRDIGETWSPGDQQLHSAGRPRRRPHRPAVGHLLAMSWYTGATWENLKQSGGLFSSPEFLG